MRNDRRLFLLAAALLAAAPLLWLVVSRDAASLRPMDGGTAPVLQWRAGSEQHYRLHVASTVRLSSGDAAAAAPMTHDVHGVLEVETLAVDAEGALVSMRLDPVELSISSVVDADQSLALAAPFRVRFAPGGLPVRFVFPANVASEHRQLLEQLVRTFQCEIRAARRWDAEESHGTGTYLARYERADDGSIRRRKVRYEPPAEGSDAPANVRVRRSEATLRLDPTTDWLAEAESHETLATEVEIGMGLEVTTDAALARLSAGELHAVEAEVASRAPERAAAAAAASVRRANPMTDRSMAELEAELLEMLAALDVAADDRPSRIHRLRDLMRADRRLAPLLLAAMQTGEWRDRTRADLFLAFELAGTEQAQAALGRVATAPDWRQMDRTRALVALGGVATPTDASLSTLWAVARERATKSAQDHANTALLALGALASRMDRTAGADYAELRDGLLSTAWGAGDPRERAIVVKALGNTGDAALTGEIVAFLDDNAPGVRRAAARTLGKFGGEPAAIELVLRLDAEPSSAVRAAMAGALVACDTLPSAAMELVRTAISREPDDVARLQLARCLGRDLAQHPENERVLRELLAAEQSNQVRRHVGELLATVDAARAREAADGTAASR